MCSVQSRCFFELTVFPAAAQRSTLVMGRQILSLSVAKAMLISIKMIEAESSYPARENSATDSLRYLFPTDACANVS